MQDREGAIEFIMNQSQSMIYDRRQTCPHQQSHVIQSGLTNVLSCQMNMRLDQDEVWSLFVFFFGFIWPDY